MSETAVSFRSLLKIRKSTVEFVDVPEFGFAMVTGSGRRPSRWSGSGRAWARRTSSLPGARALGRSGGPLGVHYGCHPARWGATSSGWGMFPWAGGLEALPASEAGPIAAWRVTYASVSPRPGAGAWGIGAR